MEKLFCDCKTDAEKSAFFLSGRAVETGVIAAAISNDVAMAYHRCDELRMDRTTLQHMVYSLKDRVEVVEREYKHVLEAKEIYQRQLNETEDERDDLRAKIEQMERQKPVAEWLPLDSGEDTSRLSRC